MAVLLRQPSGHPDISLPSSHVGVRTCQRPDPETRILPKGLPCWTDLHEPLPDGHRCCCQARRIMLIWRSACWLSIFLVCLFSQLLEFAMLGAIGKCNFTFTFSRA